MTETWETKNPRAARMILWWNIIDYFAEHYPDMTVPSTVDGETQFGGKVAEGCVARVLTEMGLSWKPASSQHSRDFQNVGGIGLDIETKKTDSNTVTMNDTRPVASIHYIIFATAARVKSKKPKIIFKTGDELINAPSNAEYLRACQEVDEIRRVLMEVIKRNKNALGNLDIYPRLKHSVNIKDFY